MRRGPAGQRAGRAQSISISYVLSLIIVTLLISGLFITMSGFLETEQRRATRSEFDVLGNRIAADIATVDRLARTTTGDQRVAVTTRIPQSVAGAGYNVLITSTGSAPSTVEIRFSSNDVDVQRNVSVKTHFPVNNSRLSGGTYEVVFTGSAFEVRNVG